MERDASKSFFLFFSHQTIHAPIEGLPADIAGKYEGRCPAGQDALRRKYCGMVAYLDDSVAEFTGLLAGAGMWDNTLLFFSTDNGGCPQGAQCTAPTKGAGCNWPLRASKASVFEGGVCGPPRG